MKKIILTIGMLIFSVGVLAQKVVDNNAYVGWWFSEASERSNLFFWIDKNNDLKLQEMSSKGEAFVLRGYERDRASVYVRSSKPRSPHKITASSYHFLDEETIYCIAFDEYTGKEINAYYKKYR